VYNARANLDIIRFDTRDPMVRLVRYEQVSNDRVRFDVDLRHTPVGYLVMWRAGSLVLRVRHLPVIDASAPLRGRVIAVDAGHPPGGAMGPTRLREAEATLPIAEQVKELLEARGARVVMLRSSAEAVALGVRPINARRENAEAFVSIHLNAFADGANPFAAARGSGTFFFHPQSEPLARAVQQGLVRQMGLRDEGIFFNNLAVVRPIWFPAVLCEGAWVVMPEQESALRTREFQRAYAMGIVEGLEAYFRDLGGR
jgi:N-acetylmuramoyl-L-alanine amidase